MTVRCAWFGSVPLRTPADGKLVENGQRVVISASVKKHDEYKGVKQTILTRCTTWTDEGLALERAKQEKKAARDAKKAAKSAGTTVQRGALKPLLVATASGTTVIAPLLHLNGTGTDDLQNELEMSIVALRHAQRKFFCPNARDFYPQGDDALARMRAEHDARCAKLRCIIEELAAIADSVQEQRNQRSAADAVRFRRRIASDGSARTPASRSFSWESRARSASRSSRAAASWCRATC